MGLMEAYDRCVEYLKVYMGLPPFDRHSNLMVRDKLFREKINKTYSKEVLEKAEATIKVLVIKWASVRNKFIKENSSG
jgi:hypothetical protein